MASHGPSFSRKRTRLSLWWVFVPALSLSYIAGWWWRFADSPGVGLAISAAAALAFVGVVAVARTIVRSVHVGRRPATSGDAAPRPLPGRAARRPPSPAAAAALICLPFVGLLGLELAFRALGPDSAEQPWAMAAACPSPEWCNPPEDVRHVDPTAPYVYGNEQDVDEFVPLAEHPEGGFRFHTNNLGLRRDEDVVPSKPTDVFRVLMLGDSQVEGYVDNDEHYPHLLEEQVRAQRGEGRVEVLNAGVGGYGPQHAYHWYRAQGAALTPDLVVLNVYVGNDIIDFNFGESIEGASIPPVDPPRGMLASAGSEGGATGGVRRASETTTDWLRTRSRLFQATANWVLDGPLTAPLTRLGMLHPDVARLRLPRVWRLVNRCHGCWFQQFAQVREATPARLQRAREGLVTILASLKREVGARGGRLVVVSIPTKPQVEPADAYGDVELSRRLLGLSEDELRSTDDVLAMVRAAAVEADVMILDPRPALTEAAQSARLYYRRDWHLDPDGHRALAGYVARELMDAIPRLGS